MANTEYGKINLFYSYAHEDEASCNEVMQALQLLRSESMISEWYDRRISPGENWRKLISENLARSKIVLLMISPDFLASDYCMGVELKQALDRHWERQCRIVPVIIRDCHWNRTKFGSFQALPTDGKPIAEWGNKTDAFTNIAEGIRAVCRDIVDWENPYRRCSIGDWTETEQTVLDKRSGQRMTITVELRVLAKSTKKQRATVGFTAKRNGQIIPVSEYLPAGFSGGTYQMGADRITIPLDAPLEDNLGSFMRQLGANLPRNAEVEKNEAGRGEQKLSIGGKSYYCSWTGYEVRIAAGMDELVCNGKTWRCIDVPLDGIVKSEQETPFFKTRSVLVDYGLGGR